MYLVGGRGTSHYVRFSESSSAAPAHCDPVRFTFHSPMLALSSSSLGFAGSSIAAPRAQASMVAMPRFDVRSMPGVSGPLGFFDPLGFASGDVSEGKVKFYREAEIKHGRVAMLATVGFIVGEQFHPMWGGNVDVPSCAHPSI